MTQPSRREVRYPVPVAADSMPSQPPPPPQLPAPCLAVGILHAQVCARNSDHEVEVATLKRLAVEEHVHVVDLGPLKLLVVGDGVLPWPNQNARSS